MSRWVQGTVAENRHWTDQLYSLKIDAPIAPFQAGQFTRLALDIDGQRVARPYSFVNAPQEPLVEIYSITVPGGPLSNRLAELQPGDSVWVATKSSGFFTLSEVPDADDLWMLATGTALGPFLSILKTEEPWQRFKNIVLVHAVRTVPELTYRETIGELEKLHGEQLIVIPFVSREETDFALHGRIPQAIEDGRLEERAGIPLQVDRSQIMLCGNPNMVRDTSEILQRHGFKRNRRREKGHITTENYW